MDVERVQRWVMSSLMLAVCFIFAGGLALMTSYVDRPGSTPGLLTMSGVVGVLAVAGVRVLNQRSVLTLWLVLGLAPVLLGAWLVHQLR